MKEGAPGWGGWRGFIGPNSVIPPAVSIWVYNQSLLTSTAPHYQQDMGQASESIETLFSFSCQLE